MKIVNNFLNFAQNIDCGYTLEPPLTSTHDLCFGAKIRKNVYPCKPQFYYIKVGCKGVFVTRTCFRDAALGRNDPLSIVAARFGKPLHRGRFFQRR